MSSSAICEGPSACRRATEEGAEGRAERLPAARLQADGGGDHLLLGDVHLEEAVRVLGGEALRVGRVADLAVERDDFLVDRADPGEGVAVGAPGGDLLADLVGRPLDRRPLDLVWPRLGWRLHLDPQRADAAQLLDPVSYTHLTLP